MATDGWKLSGLFLRVVGQLFFQFDDALLDLLAGEVGTSKTAKKQMLKIFPEEEVFDTPKPEELIYRILRIATNPGDWVLDAYLGSGTTAAVAHKIKRRYIGIEQGEHAVSHCAQRLRLVAAGEKGGISKLVNWQGGGGFDFYRFTD